MSDTVEQYPAAGGANAAAPNPGYPVNFDIPNPAAAGANAAAAAAGANAAAGAIPATPNPGYTVNFDIPNPAVPGANAAAAGAIPADPNPGDHVNCDTPCGNLSCHVRGWERVVVLMIFVALCIFLGVVYMIKNLVEDGEGKK